MSTITPIQINHVAEAKAEFDRSIERLTKDLQKTPDDKLNWSPSSTSRTPLQQVAHAAISIKGMIGMMAGEPFPFESFAAMDTHMFEAEKAFQTRESVLELLHTNVSVYHAFVDVLSESDLANTVTMPFGEFPMRSMITWPADHIRCHAGQLEYMQTIYGDRSWM